jgi:hypothetical protein
MGIGVYELHIITINFPTLSRHDQDGMGKLKK